MVIGMVSRKGRVVQHDIAKSLEYLFAFCSTKGRNGLTVFERTPSEFFSAFNAFSVNLNQRLTRSWKFILFIKSTSTFFLG